MKIPKTLGKISVNLSTNPIFKQNSCQETWKDPNKIT